MKIVCNGADLGGVLTRMSRLAGGRSPILLAKSLLLDAKEGRLYVGWSDASVVVSMDIEVQVEKEGSVLLPARLLTDIVKAVASGKKDDLSMEAGSNRGVVITAERQTSHVYGYDRDDFPPLPDVEGEAFTMPVDVFEKVVSKVVPASDDDSDAARPVLTAVLFELHTDCARFVAVDGFRLAKLETEGIEVEADRTVLVPAQQLVDFKRLASVKEDIEVVIDQSGGLAGRIKLSAPGVSMVCPLVPGQFPNYDATIPKSFGNTVTVGRKELIKCIGSVKATQISKALWITVHEKPGSKAKKNKPWIFKMEGGDRTDQGAEARTSGYVEASVRGVGGMFGINAGFLLDSLKGIDTENVHLDCDYGGRPLQVRPDSDENLRYVVMPMYDPRTAAQKEPVAPDTSGSGGDDL